MERQELYALFGAAKAGTLPADFCQWGLADRDGWTVAHEAVKYGHLPAGFTLWDLADRWGRSVAHVAAANNRLPADFDQWGLADRNGDTVAHAAAAKTSRLTPKEIVAWEKARALYALSQKAGGPVNRVVMTRN